MECHLHWEACEFWEGYKTLVSCALVLVVDTGIDSDDERVDL